MEEFQDVNTIQTRNELTDIWNYWVAKKQLIKSTQEKEKIANYLDELTKRDKEIIKENRSNSAKMRAAKKEAERLAKEAEEREYQESLVQIAEDVKKHNENKVQISLQIDNINKEIDACEKKMKKYAKKIGLTELKEQLLNLKEELNKPIKTCCKHRNKFERWSSKSLGYGEFIRYYKCSDCGYCWDD